MFERIMIFSSTSCTYSSRLQLRSSYKFYRKGFKTFSNYQILMLYHLAVAGGYTTEKVTVLDVFHCPWRFTFHLSLLFSVPCPHLGFLDLWLSVGRQYGVLKGGGENRWSIYSICFFPLPGWELAVVVFFYWDCSSCWANPPSGFW